MRAAIEELDMGGGSILRLLIRAQESRGAVAVVEVLVREGGPPHVHDAEDDAVIVLEGELAYRIGDERGAAARHELVWLPRGIPHTVANLSGRPCRFLTFAKPVVIEQLFTAQSEYIASLSAATLPAREEMERLPGAATRWAVGPPLAPEEP